MFFYCNSIFDDYGQWFVWKDGGIFLYKSHDRLINVRMILLNFVIIGGGEVTLGEDSCRAPLVMLVLSSNNDTVPEMVIVSTWQSAEIFAQFKATKNAKVKFLGYWQRDSWGISK